MFVLRRASLSNRFRNRISNLELQISTSIQNDSLIVVPHQLTTSHRRLSPKGFSRKAHVSSNPFMAERSFTSKVGSDADEDEFEGGFSEHENSFDESSKSEHNSKKIGTSLYNMIVSEPGWSVHSLLKKWVEEGNALDRDAFRVVMHKLGKAQMHGRVVLFSKWLEENKSYEFVESDYVNRILAIGKRDGAEKARQYIDSIPKSFRRELVFTALLSIYVINNNIIKAEKVFDEMKTLGLLISVYACNQMLLLYKRHQKQKMKDVLVLMERENLKPSILTYNLLIDAKGELNDIAGMEEIFESLRAEGIDPDNGTRLLMAKHYASAGLKEKAKFVLKKVEEDNLLARRSLFRIYAELEEVDEVRRIWEICEPNPSNGDFFAVIEAWGTLKNIEEAEAVFKRMLKSLKKISSVHFIPLLKVYVSHKMVEKGEEHVKLMEGSGCQMGPWTWDLLVKLYIKVGDVEKADATLHNTALQQNWSKPKISSFIAIMEQYSARGDVHNTEKIFYRIRELGYPIKYYHFRVLVQAYVNAKMPVYGMRDRINADSFYPDKALVNQLAQVDPFKMMPAMD